MTLQGKHRRCAFLTFLLASSSCTSLTDVAVTYRPCFPVKGRDYVEKFEITEQELLEGCWKIDGVAKETAIFTREGDLIVRPPPGLRWSPRERGPAAFRQMRGDFLVVTRAEATSTFRGDHCLRHGESAGLVVTRAAPFGWATLLVSPYFGSETPIAVSCVDEPTKAPSARVVAKSFAFGPASGPAELEQRKEGVGADGEAYIALCRQGDQLAYYYRAQVPKPGDSGWFQVRDPHPISRDPLDVGVTTTSGDPSDASGATGMEGHFPWIAYYDYSDAPVADGCEGALTSFVAPEE